MFIKDLVKRIPIVGEAARHFYWRLREKSPDAPFPGSDEYWEQRYAGGGNSGVGSYGKFADYKAEFINAFVREHQVASLIEFGCGDGNQLMLMEYPRYLGFDVSETAIRKCREMFGADSSRTFKRMIDFDNDRADMTLSLDVLYHLVEDEVFEDYLTLLFGSAERYVTIYSSDTDDNRGYEGTHIRHRRFTAWIESHIEGWRLMRRERNRYPYKGDYRQGSFADFFVYCRIAN